MCPLKVDRLAVRLCSSPMSASTELKQGRRAGAATGSIMPVLAMQAARPRAFMVAVLPPVLGPVGGGVEAIPGSKKTGDESFKERERQHHASHILLLHHASLGHASGQVSWLVSCHQCWDL
jgi:hypothetical protein